MIKIVTVGLMLVASAAVHAQTQAMRVTLHSPTRINVNYYAAERSNVSVTVYDSDKQVLAKRYVKNVEKFSLPVRFKNLPPGTYTVVANNGTDRMVEEISTHIKPEIFSHVSKLDDHRYLVSITASATPQSFQINIYDDSTRFVFGITQMIEGSKAVVFNTTNVANPRFQIIDAAGNSQVIQK